MKSALIIGGTGLLGRGIATELIGQSWTVTLLTRGMTCVPVELAEYRRIVADRSEPGALGNALAGLSFDLVVDCAAYDLRQATEAIQVFSATTGHYWFIGTDFVYAPVEDARFPVREDAPKISGLSYATGKLEAEEALLNAAHSRRFPVTLLRPPHILGAGKPAGCDPVAGGRDWKLLERLRKGNTIPLLAGGQLLIQPVWSREIGRCVDQLAGNGKVFGETFNAAGRECITVLCYYKTIADWCGVPLTVQVVEVGQFAREQPDQAHIARHRIYELGKLKQAGFAPSLTFNDALIETLEAYPG